MTQPTLLTHKAPYHLVIIHTINIHRGTTTSTLLHMQVQIKHTGIETSIKKDSAGDKG